VVECLLCKCEALSSNPSATQKTKNKGGCFIEGHGKGEIER
jgi:hypothetical protein